MLVVWGNREEEVSAMILTCPTCSADVPLLEPAMRVLIETLAMTVEGRKLVRSVIQSVDRRLKARPSLQENPGPEVLPRVVTHLARMRQEACLSQAILARELGVSEYTVHRWEGQRSKPGLDDCVKWARVLGTTLKDVLEK
jgi:DNA-binding XRE family transcriptional regulator